MITFKEYLMEQDEEYALQQAAAKNGHHFQGKDLNLFQGGWSLIKTTQTRSSGGKTYIGAGSHHLYHKVNGKWEHHSEHGSFDDAIKELKKSK